MTSALFKLIEPWLLGSDSEHLQRLRDQLVWLQRELFHEYEPTRYQAFDDRLAEWLTNLDDDEDRKSFLQILEHLFFVGKQQFDSLCRVAFSDQVTRWLVDEGALDIGDAQLSSKIAELVNSTWFCPITDSMRINAFLKVNELRGHDHRPDWRSLMEFGDRNKIADYIDSEGIQFVVLLEDFVGSGDQMRETVLWAAQTLPQVRFLVVPLVCCPLGNVTGNSLAALQNNVFFSPALLLRPELFLTQQAHHEEPAVFAKVREIIIRIQQRLGNWKAEAYGYQATGALIALYSNCPDNTLPIIHYSGDDWAPLFPRIQRS